MGHISLTSEDLMDEAELHYVNLVESNHWQPEHGLKEQIVLLTLRSRNSKLSGTIRTLLIPTGM